ncbi:MAG: CheR family methyltransferase [Deltaproteobacteria bacterium]
MSTQDQLVARALDEVTRHAGLFFKDVRLGGAVDTIAHWLAEHRIVDLSDIRPGIALDALLEDLVVHESYFDRDLEQLRVVDELALTQVARTTVPIRIWSAGCASGEEPYTLAFMLAARDLLRRATIIGTDLSRPALARAREGRYRAWAVRAGASSPAMRYLIRSGDEWCVPDSIKRAVEFSILNLVEDPFPSDQHLIVCRNVLIYLDPEAIATAARKFAAALAPDGWLFVAPSDPRLDPHAPLDAIVSDRGVYYRHAQPVDPLRRAVPVRSARSSTAPIVLHPPPRIARSPSTKIPPAPKQDTQTTRDRARLLADRGDHDAARAVLAEAIAATPLDAELHFLQAVLFAADDVEAALRSLDRAMYLSPEAPVSYLFAARLRQSRDDIAGARRLYTRALHLLEAFAPEVRVPWSDEPAWLMTDACRQALDALT